jgi:hypothetical protein
MTPDAAESAAERRDFKKKGRVNFVRKIQDVVQVLNFQKSNFSDDWYLNFAVWPEVLGKPERISEHTFPLRGRIEDILGKSESASDSDLDEFFDVIDQHYSSLESIRSSFADGRLDRLYVKADLKALLVG